MTTPFEFFRTPITLLRNVNGSYVNGLWEDGPSALLSAVLVTGNVVNITLNGITLAPIPFTTDSLTTLGLIQAALAAQPNINYVSLSGVNSLDIMVVPVIPFQATIDSFTITGGASQATVTLTQSPNPIPITASIQPLTGEELEMLPEARREKEIYKMFTSFQVQTLTDENPDQVQFFSKTFEIYEVKPWQNNANFTIINHYCYYVMRLQPLAP